MNLVSVYDRLDRALPLLYQLLQEREPHQCISHKVMPTWDEHIAFVASHPYACWYVIEHEGLLHGGIYLTRQREIGIGVLKTSQGRAFGPWAVQRLLEMHPGRCLANINPQNERSLAMFRDLGFCQQIQVTLERPA